MGLSSSVVNRPKSISSVIVREIDHQFSRKSITVLAGDGAARALLLGTVLGAVLLGTPVISPDGGNTGNGALGTLTLGSAAKAGTYAVTCIAESADGGVFQVVDPDGYRLADASVGVAYAEAQLGFTITDGAADWDLGDVVEIDVPVGSGKVVMLDTDATDGTQHAWGVLVMPVTAPDATDAPGQAVDGYAVLRADGLVWPDGITANEKTAALAALAQRNFVTL